MVPQDSPPINPADEHTKLDGRCLNRLAHAALAWLDVHQPAIDALNVFPIPDGDTGKNMWLTMQAACQAVDGSDDDHVGRVAHALANGALMGARGNSGVILSQLWRGFAQALEGCATAGADDLVGGLNRARDAAYQGVVRPVEGTILTVAKDVAAAAKADLANGATITTILQSAVQAAHDSVQRTPELLPVLRQAGVVDSGGQGLFIVLEGMLRSAWGQSLAAPAERLPLPTPHVDRMAIEVEPGQDFEVVVDFRPHQPLDLSSFHEGLARLGTSIQIGEGDGLYRVHIHVPLDKRYDPIEYAMALGTVSNVHMENLVAQLADLALSASPEPRLAAQISGHVGVVAVAPGAGLERVLGGLGAAVVRGGQTMNPSAGEILQVVESLPAKEIIVLPNNPNVLMAAQQAAGLSTKRVTVVPSRSVPQGIAALLTLNPAAPLDQAAAAMVAALPRVRTGEVTQAVRASELDGVRVRRGQFMGLIDDQLCVAGDSLDAVVHELLGRMGASDCELVTLYAGIGVDSQEATALADRVRTAFPNSTVEVHDGGQPHYPYILSVE